MYFRLLLLLILSLNQASFATDDSHIQRMQTNGVSFADKTAIVYTDYQLSLLESFNFDVYRNYDSQRIVQIEDGPKIVLESLLDMQNRGKQIPETLLKEKQDRNDSDFQHQIITLINIGFKYAPHYHTESGF